MTWNAPHGVVNHTGMYAGYRRLQSVQKVRPPFTWHGTIRLNDVKNPPVFTEGWHAGETATYQPKLNFHPLYPSNNRNVVLGPGNVQGDPKVVGISAEMRDVRPERPYGVRTGYEQRYRIPLPSTPVDGEWHRFKWVVPSYGEYMLYWDDLLVCHVIEKAPYTIDPGPVSVALRLDFLDVDLGPMYLEEDPVVSIPGVKTVHQRSAWVDPKYPVFGPSDHTGVFEDLVAHYPGTSDVPDRDYQGHIYVDPAKFNNDLFGYYRQMNRSYLEQRGYAVGYQFGIDYLGGVTVLRGLDLNNAANAGGKLPGNWNHRSASVQFVTDIDQPATDLQLYSFAMIVASLRVLGHRATVRTHSYGEWTACPGPVGDQLAAGMGEPSYWVQHGPPPGAAPLPDYLVPPKEEDMKRPYIAKPPASRHGQSWLYVGESGVTPASSADIGEVPELDMQSISGTNTVTGKPYRDEQYDALKKAAGL